jgi:DNA-binding Lrp family transcriptional regulator
MKDKEKYLIALKQNNGEQDEYTLGEMLGFTDEQTKQIIEELEQEGKIEFISFGLCSYQVVK